MRNLPKTEKFKYIWVVYHSSDVVVDSITYQRQACDQYNSDVQKCRYFKQMVQGDKTLKTPRSCKVIFPIRSLCNTVLPDMLLPLPLNPALDDRWLYIYIYVYKHIYI